MKKIFKKLVQQVLEEIEENKDFEQRQEEYNA